jgi:hypothetical protein
MRLMDPRTLEHLPARIRPRLVEADPLTLRQLRHLSDKDRLIMELTLESRASRRQLAAALNLAPGNVTRRYHSILRRLRDPLVLSLTSPDCTLPPQHREIGIGRFLHRSTIRQLMREYHLTYGQVKHTLEYIRGWHRGMSDSSLCDTSMTASDQD